MAAAAPLPSTQSVRSLPHLVGMGLGGLACLGGAVALFANEHQGWGALAGFFGLCLLFSAPMFREGTCPRCAHVQSALGATWCPGCRDWFETEGDRFIAIAPGHISKATIFTVPLSSFVPPTDVNWPWPGQCCVCGRPGARTSSVKLTVGQDQGLTTQMHTWAVQIPYCAEHSDGVDWASSPSRVSFRSYDYARAFQAANRARIG
jgi:hypothetical protein